MIQKITFIFALFALLFSTAFLVSADALGITSDCPLMTGHSASLCMMNPLEHIQEWQSAFTVTPAQNSSVSLFAVLLLSFAILNIKIWKKILLSLSSLLLVRKRRILIQLLKIRDQFQEAFSSGILNPKAF